MSVRRAALVLLLLVPLGLSAQQLGAAERLDPEGRSKGDLFFLRTT